MAYQVLIIQNKTNLLVGSGKANFGIVDQLVQRDVATGFPNINASGVKGAFKEFVETYHQDILEIKNKTVSESGTKETLNGDNKQDSLKIKRIFGSETGSNETQNGEYHFFNADLLSLPVRSSHAPFLNVTCPEVITHLLDLATHFGIELDITITGELKQLAALIKSKNECFVFEDALVGAAMEDEDIFSPATKHTVFKPSPALINLLGNRLAIVHDDVFKMLVSDLFLPIIPRNSLEEGKENLWYEQVVPRESVFFTFVYENHDWDKFYKIIKSSPVQMGSNSSIGYGQCVIQSITDKTTAQ